MSGWLQLSSCGLSTQPHDMVSWSGTHGVGALLCQFGTNLRTSKMLIITPNADCSMVANHSIQCCVSSRHTGHMSCCKPLNDALSILCAVETQHHIQDQNQTQNQLPHLLQGVCHAWLGGGHINGPTGQLGPQGLDRLSRFCQPRVGYPRAEGCSIRGICKACPLLLWWCIARMP